MRTAKVIAVICLGCLVLLSTGCAELKDLQVKNADLVRQNKTLEGDLQTKTLRLEELERKLAGMEEEGTVEKDSLNAKIAALQEDLGKKKTLIAALQEKIMMGGGQLPVELSTKLEDLAGKYANMMSYDAGSGILKFKSDLLFEKGSDVVADSAITAIKQLCTILNSADASKFDVIVAGHTDNVPIERPMTKEKHPTNWHLSADRAISVLKIMTSSNVDPTRLSVRGFGEYRPVAENAPDNKGNPLNRRVEIYIVPKGM